MVTVMPTVNINFSLNIIKELVFIKKAQSAYYEVGTDILIKLGFDLAFVWLQKVIPNSLRPPSCLLPIIILP
jgi:hypothetical protein